VPWQRSAERRAVLSRPLPVRVPACGSFAHEQQEPEAADTSSDLLAFVTCSNLRRRAASLERDAAGEGRATCHCLAGAQPASSVARASGPIISLAQCAYGGLWSILGEWDPRTFTSANSLQTSAPAQIPCERQPCCVRRGAQRSTPLPPGLPSAGSAFRQRRGGRRQAVAQRDASGQEPAMEFVRPPRGELPVEKRPDFGGTDVE